MTNLILLVLCLLIGVGLQYVKSLPKDTYLSLNSVILYVPLPALALLAIPRLQWELNLLSLCFVPWIMFALSFLFFSYLGKKLQWSDSVTGCLVITAGLGNTAFVGFPMIESYLGKEAVKYAIFLDQSGSFLIVSTVAVWVAALFASGELRKRDLARKIVFFPPFIAFTSALLLGFMGWQAEGPIEVILMRLESILMPLALISVGLQLRLKDIKTDLNYLSYGLCYKLVLFPFLIALLYRALGISGIIYQVSVLEAAMAPMITGSILAQSYGLHPRLAGSMLGLGVPLSFITVTVWSYLL